MKTSISKTVGTLCLSLLSAVALCLVSVPVSAQDTLRHEVLMETSMGNIRLALYNETPLHRDNFIKNVREGVYDGLLFHRVISSFMIQGGDTASRNAAPGQQLGDTEESYSIPAEIRLPNTQISEHLLMRALPKNRPSCRSLGLASFRNCGNSRCGAMGM